MQQNELFYGQSALVSYLLSIIWYVSVQSTSTHISIYFNNRICDIWNDLPNFVFDVSAIKNGPHYSGL